MRQARVQFPAAAFSAGPPQQDQAITLQGEAQNFLSSFWFAFAFLCFCLAFAFAMLLLCFCLACAVLFSAFAGGGGGGGSRRRQEEGSEPT